MTHTTETGRRPTDSELGGDPEGDRRLFAVIIAVLLGLLVLGAAVLAGALLIDSFTFEEPSPEPAAAPASLTAVVALRDRFGPAQAPVPWAPGVRSG